MKRRKCWKTLAIVHISRASHDRCLWFDPLFPLILTCQFNFLSQHPAFHYNPTPPMRCGLLIHIPHILVPQWRFICSELAGLGLDCSSVPFKSVPFYQTSAHGAFILRVLLGVEWLQGGSASTLDGDWPLCACSLFVGSCCLVFSFVSSEYWLPPSITAFIPLWIFPASFSGLSAGAFCIQFVVQEAWVSYVFILNYYSRWSIYPRSL